MADSHVNPSTLVLPAQKASGVLAWAGKRGGERERWGGVGWGAGPLRSQELGAGGGGAGIGDSLPEAVVPLLSSPSARWDSLGKGKGGGEQRCPSDSGRRGGQTDRLIDQQCSPRVHPPPPPRLAHSFGGDWGSAPRSPMWSGGGGKARGWEAAAGGRSSPIRLR